MPHNRPQQYYEDEIHSFFENCFHLNDWLKNDNKPYLAFNASSVDGNKVKASRYMEICRAICIGDKHFNINDEFIIDKKTKFCANDIEIRIGNPHIIKLKYYVKVNGDIIDVEKIADECITEWKEFLKLNNLI